MRIRKKKIKFLLFAFLLVSVLSCQKIDVAPRLEILVLDKDGIPVEGAEVGIFDSFESWSIRENPSQFWRSTNEDGKVIFADLHHICYYVFAHKDRMDNTSSEIKTCSVLEDNKMYQLTVSIR